MEAHGHEFIEKQSAEFLKKMTGRQLYHYTLLFAILTVFFIACNANSQEHNQKNRIVVEYIPPFKAPLYKYYTMKSATLDWLLKNDSTVIGYWAGWFGNKIGEAHLKKIYTKNKEAYEDNFTLGGMNNDSVFFDFTEKLELLNINGKQFLYDKVGPYYYAIAKEDSTMFRIIKDSTKSDMVYIRLENFYTILSAIKSYRTNCRKHDSSTLYRWSYNGSFAAIFRLYKLNNDYYLQTYSSQQELSNDKLIPTQHPLGTRFDYANTSKDKIAGEYFVVQTKDTALLLFNKHTEKLFETGSLKRNWRYDYSRLDSAWFHY